MVVYTLTRRGFVRGALSVVSLLRVPLVDATPHSLIPRAVLFDNPDITSVRLSYDGTMLAYSAPRDGVRNLWVAPLNDLPAARPLTHARGRGIGSFFQWAFTHRHVVFFQDHDGDENWRAASVDIASGAIVPLTPLRGVRSYRQEVSPFFPTTMLFGHNERDKRYYDLYRINIITGAAELLYENPAFTSLLTDSAFALRLSAQVQKNGAVVWRERQPDGSWQELLTVPLGDVDTTRPLGLSADGTTLYLLDSRGRDKAALIAFDMASRASHILAEDAEADLTDVVFTTDTRVPRAAGGMVERQRWQVLDSAMAEALASAARVTTGDLYFSSQSFDGNKTVVYVEHDAQGLQDVRVTRAESEQMVAALQARRVPVTYITFADEGHGFSRPANQIAFRAVTEAFLAAHLGGACEPINPARDFHGSSLAIEAGAEHIPGLVGTR